MAAANQELAVLKGRVDSLESRVGNLEQVPSNLFKTGLLIIDEYDIATGEVKKTAKNIQGNWYSRFNRVSTDDKAIFYSQKSGVLFKETNTTGVWPTVSVYEAGHLSTDGQDLVIGAAAFDGDSVYSVGVLKSNKGGFLIVNKQNV